MEVSTNDIDTNQSFKSPPRRRRSTFFERRESLVPQPMTEIADPKVCKQATETCIENDENLKRYYDQLLSEKDQWKKEVNNRRNQYHDLRQQCQMALKAPRRSQIGYSALTNEDIEFLKAKVNVSKLVDSQLKLHKSLKETRAFYRRANELNHVILSQWEDRVNKITEYIFENSTIEPK